MAHCIGSTHPHIRLLSWYALHITTNSLGTGTMQNTMSARKMRQRKITPARRIQRLQSSSRMRSNECSQRQAQPKTMRLVAHHLNTLSAGCRFGSLVKSVAVKKARYLAASRTWRDSVSTHALERRRLAAMLQSKSGGGHVANSAVKHHKSHH